MHVMAWFLDGFARSNEMLLAAVGRTPRPARPPRACATTPDTPADDRQATAAARLARCRSAASTIAAMILVSTPGTLDRGLPAARSRRCGTAGRRPTSSFRSCCSRWARPCPSRWPRRRGEPRVVRRHRAAPRARSCSRSGSCSTRSKSPPAGWATFRIPGVLQRIALVYLAVTWMTERLSPRAQVAVVISALAGYWAAMTWIPVPGAGAGVLTPEGNLASFVDRALLGRHLADDAVRSRRAVEHRARDRDGDGRRVCRRLAEGAARNGAARPTTARRGCWRQGAARRSPASAWGRVFPINKNLWTSSFALLAAGLAAAGDGGVPLDRRHPRLARAGRGRSSRSGATRCWPTSSPSASTAVLTRSPSSTARR